MKIFFGQDLDDMILELRAQGVALVRVQVLPKIQDQNMLMQTYVTTFCNNQVYEAVIPSRASLNNVPRDRLAEFIRQQCERARQKTTERLKGFEVKRGILQV